jgi:S1/P1 Nuclease
VRKLLPTLLLAVALGAAPPLGFAWGHKGHEVIALIAEHYLTGAALTKTRDLLGGAGMASVASWADDYRHDHPETGPWHYIDIPLSESKLDMARDCPNGQCVIAQTEHFLSVLKDPNADNTAKAEALKFVVHFVGDLHQPLHDEDDGDKGGNTRHVVFDGKPDNLHWVWDTGMLEHINRNPEAFATELGSHVTPQDRAEWTNGTIEDWILDGHHLAQTVVYGDLGSQDPAPITAAYEQQAGSVIELFNWRRRA